MPQPFPENDRKNESRMPLAPPCRRISVLLAALGALCAFPAPTASAQTRLTAPAQATIFQRGPDGRAAIPFHVAPGSEAVTVTLARAGEGAPLASRTVAADGGAESFADVPAGLYEVCAKPEAAKDAARQCRKVGVGEAFVVAGQSNAVSPADPGKPAISATGLVSVSAHHGDGPSHENEEPDTTTLLFPSAENPAQAGACWVRLGDMLAQKDGVPVGFVIVARSATNTDCWNPAGGACWPLLARTLASRPFRAVLWHQGESDAMGHFPAKKTLANMTAMIEASQAIAPGMPWIVAHNSLKNEIPYEKQPVRQAQAAVVAGLACAGPDTDPIRENPDWVGVADFGAGGLTRHGELWFPVVDAFLSRGECRHAFAETP